MVETYIGEIRAYAGTFIPQWFKTAPSSTWIPCDGRLINISQYEGLFSLIGTTYGGDGRSTFGVPNLMNRVIIGAGQGGGLSNYNLGQSGGVTDVTLKLPELPTHNHTGTVTRYACNNPAITGDPNNARQAVLGSKGYGTSNDGDMLGAVVSNAGGDGAHDNIQPTSITQWLIAGQGIFPTRD